jgi:hypothetical protein
MPEGGAGDALPAQDGVTEDPLGVVNDTPWLLIAGGVGLAASLLAAESVRRRRRT